MGAKVRGNRVIRLSMCKVCKTRQARFINGTCQACNALVNVEGTHEQLGVAAESPTRQRWRQQALEYNRLARKGLLQKDIAALWGMKPRALASLVARMKTEGGLKIVNLGRGHRDAEGKLVATNKTNKLRGEHGVGWGVTGCTCQPCKESSDAERQRVSKNRNKRYQDKIARLQARVDELEKLVAQLRSAG